MSGTQRIDLNALVSPAAARVVVQVDPDGQVREASFDLAGLPRVDQLLIGRPVTEVPGLVERLCGICPAAHHLAGVAALETVLGVRELPLAAQRARRLLHLASVLDNHAVRYFQVDRDAALRLRRLAKQAMAAAGSPGHFPSTAVPGGVNGAVGPQLVPVLQEQLDESLDLALRLARQQLAAADGPAAPYPGAEIALVDQAGRPDLFGTRLRAQRGPERVLHDIGPDEWTSTVAEERAGDAAPRPYLVALGAEAGSYRVGPVSQLRIGELTTTRAAELQARWLAGDGSALSARAVVMVHCIEAIQALLADPAVSEGPIGQPLPERPAGITEGTGWVDGPRGLLVHHYRADADGTLVGAQILTPTAQNERWLAGLLRNAATAQDDLAVRAEASIREADPCLPCTSAPPGAMDLTIDVEVG